MDFDEDDRHADLDAARERRPAPVGRGALPRRRAGRRHRPRRRPPPAAAPAALVARTLLFLGVRDGGRSASFLNLADAPVSGAGCKPSPEDCERITLRAGRTAYVGGVPVTITRASQVRRLATAEAAEEARVREDEVGRALVADEELDLGDLAS